MGGVVRRRTPTFSSRCTFPTACPVDMILLGVAHLPRWASAAPPYIERALLGWQREGYRFPASSRALSASAGPTRGPEKKRNRKSCWAFPTPSSLKPTAVIADWYRKLGYGPDMVARLPPTRAKKSVKYVNGILRAWYTKGYKTVRDVAESAMGSSNVQAAAPAVKTQYSRRRLRRTACAGHAAGRENTMNRDELYRRAQSIVAGRRQRAVTAARRLLKSRADSARSGRAGKRTHRSPASAARLAAMGSGQTAVDAALARHTVRQGAGRAAGRSPGYCRAPCPTR